MVIAVNTRLLLKGKLEGIGWFTYETLKRMTLNHPEHEFIFIFDRPYNKDYVFAENVIPVVIGPAYTASGFCGYLWFEFQIPRILKKYKADVFLSPDGYLSQRTDIPQLGVIHDINFVHRPDDLPWLKAKYYNYFFPKFARLAKTFGYSFVLFERRYYPFVLKLITIKLMWFTMVSTRFLNQSRRRKSKKCGRNIPMDHPIFYL